MKSSRSDNADRKLYRRIKMDRIIAKIDNQGHKIAFCSDTMNSNSILMWEPGMEPKKVSLDFYHQTKPLPEQEALELAEKYEATWGQPTQLMVRLPRILRERPKFKPARKMGSIAQHNLYNKRATDSKGEQILTEMPRSLLELSKGQEATGAYPARDNAPTETIKEFKKDVPTPQKFIMRPIGKIWKISNEETGNTVGYASDEATGLKILQDLLGEKDFLQ